MELHNRIAKGNTAELYLWDGKAVKLFWESASDREAEYEADKQRRARAMGLPVPEVYDVRRIGGRQAIIMEYAKGRSLGESFLEDQTCAEYYLDIAAGLQQRLHLVDAEGFEPGEERLRRRIEAAEALLSCHKTKLCESLAGTVTRRKLCHGDFHVFNLIETNNGIYIIDWVDATAGPPEADVCRSWLLYSGVSQELAELYLYIYCAKTGMSKTDILWWAPILAGARLSENAAGDEASRLYDIVKHFYDGE